MGYVSPTSQHRKMCESSFFDRIRDHFRLFRVRSGGEGFERLGTFHVCAGRGSEWGWYAFQNHLNYSIGPLRSRAADPLSGLGRDHLPFRLKGGGALCWRGGGIVQGFAARPGDGAGGKGGGNFLGFLNPLPLWVQICRTPACIHSSRYFIPWKHLFYGGCQCSAHTAEGGGFSGGNKSVEKVRSGFLRFFPSHFVKDSYEFFLQLTLKKFAPNFRNSIRKIRRVNIQFLRIFSKILPSNVVRTNLSPVNLFPPPCIPPPLR